MRCRFASLASLASRGFLGLAALGLLLAVSCTQSPSPPDEEDGPDSGTETVLDAPALPPLRLDVPLSGREVAIETAGPWTVRRVLRESAHETKGEMLARDAAAFGEPGAPPPPGSEAVGGVETEEGGLLDASPVPHLAKDEGDGFAYGGGAGGASDRFDAGDAAGEVTSSVATAEKSRADGEVSGRPARRATLESEAAAHEPSDADRTPLRAASSDDNADFAAFLDYLTQTQGRQDLNGFWESIDVHDRRFVRAVTAGGKPVPGAEVLVLDESRDQVIGRGATYGDGRVPFYPSAAASPESLAAASDSGEAAARKWVVQVRYGDAVRRVDWDGSGEELAVTLDDVTVELDPVRLDVVFLIDTTGSMGDEIARIKGSLLDVTGKLRSLEREFDLRYGAVLYRDLGDDYVTKAHPFTGDIEAFDRALADVQANGGGDGPESLNQGLAVAIDAMDWRRDAAKVVFLIADAQPHMDYEGDVSYATSARAALARGIRVHSVAASGLGDAGTVAFRQIAQLTRGKFIFIEYGGSTAATAASHGVTGKVEPNNLADIIYEQIREEVASWGR